MIVIGVDGGGTKTEAVVYDGQHILGRGLAGPSNFQAVGIGRAMAEIVDAIGQASRQAGIDPRAAAAMWAGLAGLNTERDRRILERELRARYPGLVIALDNDAYNCLATATDGPGVAVIAGTGSIAVGLDRFGRRARAGGWGPLLGDEGSGYDVGRQALQAVCRASDGRGPETRLTKRLIKALGVASAEDLYELVYDKGLPRERIAELAVVVAELAGSDPIARTIFRRAGSALGRAARAVMVKLDLVDCELPVVLCGGLFKASANFIGDIRREIVVVNSRAYPVIAGRPPALGAARLAARLWRRERYVED